MSGPLSGVRVIELTTVVLGPWACQMLGDMGADVVKVEPPDGDSNRQVGPSKHPGMGAFFLTCNRNKRSVVLDLKQEAGRRALFALVRDADVLVHNYRPKPLARLGLDYAAIRAVNPRIVHCATYGFGRRGPYADRPAYDDSIQAASGLAMLRARMGGEPEHLPTLVADKTTALAVVSAVVSALYCREKTGRGQEIEVPMYETLVAYSMVEHQYGLTFDPPVASSGYPRLLSAYRRPYRTQDGYLAVLPYLDRHWRAFCELAGRPDLATDARFATLRTRSAHIDAVYEEVAHLVAQRTTSDWLARLASTDIPHTVVNSFEALVDDPHLAAVGFWQTREHPTEGPLRVPGVSTSFSETPATIRRLPPRLGEHSVEVLREAGLTDDEIAALLAAGVTRTAHGDI